MPERLTPSEAVARLRPTDVVGVPLGPGQPPAFLAALGERDDWVDLTVAGALLVAGSEAYLHPNVRVRSGFFGPLERYLRDQGADVDFMPADFRRFGPFLRKASPRVMATIATPPDADGMCGLSLLAGGTIDELRRAGADPDRLLVVEVSEAFPRTRGLPPEHPHALHVDEIDVLVASEAAPVALPEAAPKAEDEAIARHAISVIPAGATLQTGIGAIPTAIATALAEQGAGGYGVHTEMFTDGLMRLHEAGQVSNEKGLHDGVSITTFAFGSQELYDWLDGGDAVAFLPVHHVNDPSVIARNRAMVTINGALAVDVHGQVVADAVDGRQVSGAGGQEDFIAGTGSSLEDRSLVCLASTVEVEGERRSRILPWHPAGTVVTTPRHQVDVIVTEHGVAELEGLTVRERGEALAAVAHPDFRDGLREAAEAAARGRVPGP